MEQPLRWRDVFSPGGSWQEACCWCWTSALVNHFLLLWMVPHGYLKALHFQKKKYSLCPALTLTTVNKLTFMVQGCWCNHKDLCAIYDIRSLSLSGRLRKIFLANVAFIPLRISDSVCCAIQTSNTRTLNRYSRLIPLRLQFSLCPCINFSARPNIIYPFIYFFFFIFGGSFFLISHKNRWLKTHGRC